VVLYPTPNSTFKWLGGEEDSLEGMEVICLHSRVRRVRCGSWSGGGVGLMRDW